MVKVKMAVYVYRETHKRAKVLAAYRGMNLSEYIADIIDEEYNNLVKFGDKENYGLVDK